MDTFERGEVGDALDDPDRFKVFVFTVQSLLRPDSKDACPGAPPARDPRAGPVPSTCNPPTTWS
ncbi:MAG: hypothetical protein WKF73_17670 [Nocardioidaceae bacterium]